MMIYQPPAEQLGETQIPVQRTAGVPEEYNFADTATAGQTLTFFDPPQAGGPLRVFKVPARPPDEALFLALSGWWHESTDLLSRPQGKLAHQAYRQIIAMEDRALPFILAELNSVGGQWFAALREITGKNPVRPEHMGHTEQMRADWIAWGRANGFNAQLGVYAEVPQDGQQQPLG